VHARVLVLRGVAWTSGGGRHGGARTRRDAIRTLDLNYVVITSVDRDDLADGGASIFADTIRETRARLPECRHRSVDPDFQGNEAALQDVLDARPDILNHNTETVPRLFAWRDPADATRARSSCSTARALRAGDSDQDGHDGGARRRARRAGRHL